MPSVQSGQPLSRRTPSASDQQQGLNTTYIIGIVLALVLILSVSIWLGIRYLKNRREKRRQSNLGSTFLSVRGVVKDEPPAASSDEKFGRSQLSVKTNGNNFSRSQLNSGIVMPERTLGPRVGSDSKEEILNFHRQYGTVPRPFSFSPAPPSPTTPNSLAPPVSGGGDRVSWVRHSFMSAASIGNRYSVSSSASSFGTEPTTGTVRKVRQPFSPVLPDELLITRVGEQLTVVQSFDDGWCVVGREDPSGFHQKKSLFKSTPETEGQVELGVVPAWCFLKPVKGLRAERPMRTTSLGVKVQIDTPSRDQVISWANF